MRRTARYGITAGIAAALFGIATTTAGPAGATAPGMTHRLAAAVTAMAHGVTFVDTYRAGHRA